MKDSFDKGGRQKLGNKSADQWEEGGDQNLLRDGGVDNGLEAPRDISTKEFKQVCDPWDEQTWKPGGLPRGGAPKFKPKGDAGTHQRGPVDMTFGPGKVVKNSFGGGRKDHGKKSADQWEE